MLPVLAPQQLERSACSAYWATPASALWRVGEMMADVSTAHARARSSSMSVTTGMNAYVCGLRASSLCERCEWCERCRFRAQVLTSSSSTSQAKLLYYTMIAHTLIGACNTNIGFPPRNAFVFELRLGIKQCTTSPSHTLHTVYIQMRSCSNHASPSHTFYILSTYKWPHIQFHIQLATTYYFTYKCEYAQIMLDYAKLCSVCKSMLTRC